VIAVYRLNPTRHADEFRQLSAVDLVVSRQDVVDERDRLGDSRECVRPTQGRQLVQYLAGVQPFLQCRLLQADLATTAKIKFQAPEDRSGSWQLNSNLPYGLIQAKNIGFWRGGFQACIHGR
jgi:hypothetical protein